MYPGLVVGAGGRREGGERKREEGKGEERGGGKGESEKGGPQEGDSGESVYGGGRGGEGKVDIVCEAVRKALVELDENK